MLRASRCRHHKPTAERWLFFSAHQWELKPVRRHAQLNLDPYAQATRRYWPNGEDRTSHAAWDRSQCCEAIPGRAGPTFLGQSRLVSEEQ